MAEFVKEHSPEDFAPLLAELTRKRLSNNLDRSDSGPGRTQAFGVIRRWSYRPWVSRNTWKRPELWDLLLDFATKHVTIPWDGVQVNDNYTSLPHRDKGNQGLSYIVGFGDYEGGELNVEGTLYNINHAGHLFNGSEKLHYTEPWKGSRYSLVFFSIVFPRKFLPGYAIACRRVEDGLEITDTYDDSIIVLNRKGQLVREIRRGQPMPWIGRLTEKSQKSAAVLPATSRGD